MRRAYLEISKINHDASDAFFTQNLLALPVFGVVGSQMSGQNTGDEQVMKLGFLNLAKKISLTSISRLTKDESH